MISVPNLAMLCASVPVFNLASGGTESTITDYNGTGETWRLHTFTSSGTLTVNVARLPFAYLIVGGGKPGGTATSHPGASGGNGGEVIEDLSVDIAPGSYTITIGGSNQDTTAFSQTAVSGDGAAGGTPNSASAGGPGASGTSSSITGASVVYGSGGGAGGAGQMSAGSAGGSGGPGAGDGGAGGSTNLAAPGQAGTAGTANRGGGGGGGGGASLTLSQPGGAGGAGGSGLVVLAYRIS